METFEHVFPYCVISFTVLIVTIFSAIFMMSNKIDDLRTWLALALTDTFVVCTVTTLSLIVATGNKTMTFEPGFLKWLGGATIAEVAGIVAIVFRFFFTNPGNALITQNDSGQAPKLQQPQQSSSLPAQLADPSR